MNCISDPKAMHPTSCSENERREEKQPQSVGLRRTMSKEFVSGRPTENG